MDMTFTSCNGLEILILNTTSHFGFQFTSAILQPETPYIKRVMNLSRQEHWSVNLHTLLSDLTLAFISCGKNAKNRKTTYHYKLEVEW